MARGAAARIIEKVCKTYHFASPIFGIGIKDEAVLVRKTEIKYKQKGHDRKDGQPL